jgi:riboflavin transporter FmnP
MNKNLFGKLKNIDRNVWIQFIGESMNSIALMMLMPFFALYLKAKVDSLTHVGIAFLLTVIIKQKQPIKCNFISGGFFIPQ